jgi:hypothetical protein
MAHLCDMEKCVTLSISPLSAWPAALIEIIGDNVDRKNARISQEDGRKRPRPGSGLG